METDLPLFCLMNAGVLVYELTFDIQHCRGGAATRRADCHTAVLALVQGSGIGDRENRAFRTNLDVICMGKQRLYLRL